MSEEEQTEPITVEEMVKTIDTAIRLLRKHLTEKRTVSREFVQRFFPCQCDSAYKGRGLTMPGCPYHDTGWEEMLTELGFIVEEEASDEI